MKLAPVVLFTFNRPKHTLKTLNALMNSKLSELTVLYIFSDGPRNEKDIKFVNEVKKCIHSIKKQNKFSEVHIHENNENKGLAKSVIDGVTQVFSKHNSVIVLEDDLIVSRDYLEYMNAALSFYKDTNAGSITGYNPLKLDSKKYKFRTYSIQRNCSFGWGTWKDIWDKIDWDVKLYSSYRKDFAARKRFNQAGYDRSIRLDRQMKKDAQSWSIRFGFNLFMMNKLTYYPINSKITPIGWDGSGTHVASGINNFNTKIDNCWSDIFEIQDENVHIKHKMRTLYGYKYKDKLKEYIFWIRNLIK